jgi:hypothetical protein
VVYVCASGVTHLLDATVEVVVHGNGAAAYPCHQVLVCAVM